MATNYWSSAYGHDSDANFRAWGDDLSTKWQALGLVKTADTGQIDWTTVTRPAAGVAAGYEIFYLNDSLHATAPIYMKIAYGTAITGTTTPGTWIQIGTGSNGTGTLTNPSTNTSFNQLTASFAVSTSVSYTYAACVTEGVFWFMGAFNALSASNYPHWFVRVTRTADANGDPTTFGGGLFAQRSYNGSDIATSYFRNSPSFSYKTQLDTQPSFRIPYHTSDASTTDPNGNIPAYLTWYAFPEAKAFCGTAVVPVASLAAGSTATFNLFGSNPQTFMATGTNTQRQIGTNNSASPGTHSLMMIWE